MFAVARAAAVAAFVASFSDAQAQMQTFFTQPTSGRHARADPLGLGRRRPQRGGLDHFGMVIFTAPWAAAYRQITGDKTSTEEVFG